MFIRLRRVQPRTRTRSGACTSDTYMRTAPTLTSADVNPSPDAWAALWLAAAITARPRPTRDSATRHPCRQAAFFLPCASRPPDACRVSLARPRQRLGQDLARALARTDIATAPLLALSSPLAPVSTPWLAVAGRPTMKSRRQMTLLALQPSAVPPSVAQGRNFPLVPRHRCIYRAQAPRSWPQDVPQFEE